jgi:hypothetical protein
MKRIHATHKAILSSVLLLSLTPMQRLFAQSEKSAAFTIEASQENYPDGSKWPTPQYEKPKTEHKLAVADASSSKEMAPAAATEIQSELPAGYTAGSAKAIRLSQDVSVARFATVGASETTDTPPPANTSKQTTVKWIVDYPVLYKGVPLSQSSDLLVITGGDGVVQYVRKRNLPRSVDATEPTVDKKAAAALGTAQAKNAAGSVKTSDPTLEVWVDPMLKGHLAWSFTVQNDSGEAPIARRYWVSAVGAAQVLNWESQVYSTHFGTVTGTVWQSSPFNPTGDNPLPFLTVNRVGGGGGSATTGLDGRYGFTSGGGAATINAGLSGLHSVVFDLGGPLMTRSQSGTPASAIDLNFAGASEFQLAEVSGFYWANFIHTFANDILTPTDLVALPTKVNLNANCNAFWNGSSINFFRAGSGCPNTAYSDVILHEYGHGIDSSKGGILDGSYSEGFGDSMAILGTRQSCVGRDFFGPGTCLRPATNVDLWPSPSPEVHETGKRYMEFVWQLVQELKKTESEDDSFQIATHLVLGAALANPSNIPDAVRLSYIVDDDDGNLSNGTPHCTQLSAAADSRNIPHPACPPQKLAYAWADQPKAASYTPSLPYSYNSAGGPITITRSDEGSYAVKFAGLGGNGMVGGNVQVTGYGSGHEICHVKNWSSGGPDFIVNVKCKNALGIEDDVRYTVLVTWR